MFNSSFSKFLTKNHLFFQIFDKKSSPLTKYLILNKNLSENDDNDDEYKFFWNKKQGKNKGFEIWGVGKK